jgi:pyruvate dehydrogenase E2 component (dihydrolipoamide acetyltransferase)
MPTEVILPKVDMDMATGRISRWFVEEGAAVKKGDLLFEIETDKAAMEIDAPASGTLANVTGREGVDIPVGEAVAWIYAEGETPAKADAAPIPAVPSVPGPAAPPAPAANGAAPAVSASQIEPGSESVAGIRATPLARRLARQRNVDLAALDGTGPKGRVQAKDVERAATVAAEAREKAPAVVPAAGHTPARGDVEVRARAVGQATAPITRQSSAASTWLRQGEGTPLVLIHGFGSETASWRPLLTAFDRRIPILSIDLPGHGAAVDLPAGGFDDLVAHVESELAAQNIGVAHLAGHSLGGAAAAAVAAGVAVEARSLLLIAPAGLGPEINTGFTEGFAAAHDETALRTWMRELVADPAVLSDGFVKATLRARADGRLPAAQTRLGPLLFSQATQRFSVRGLFERLAMPVKVIAGGADRIIPSRQVQGLPGHVGVHLFAGLGHMPHLEAREAVARLLAEIVR